MLDECLEYFHPKTRQKNRNILDHNHRTGATIIEGTKIFGHTPFATLLDECL